MNWRVAFFCTRCIAWGWNTLAAAGSFDDITTLGSSERPGEDYVCSPLLAEDINSCRAKYKLTMPWQICCIAKCMSWTCCVQSLFQQDQVNSSDTLSFALSRNSRNSILHELARGIFLYEMHCMRVEHMAAAGSFDDITTLGSSERPGEDYVCSPLLAEDINSCRAKYKLTMPWQICCIAKCMSWTCCVQSLFQQDQVNSSDTLSFALSRNSRNSILHELARGIFLYEMHCMRVEHMAAAGSFDDITTLGSSERPGEDYVCSPLLAEDINSCRAKYKLTMPWQICCIAKCMSWTCCVQSLFQQDQVNSSDTLSFALSRNSRNSILHELARGIFLYEMHCMRVEHMAAAGSFDDITTLGSSERPGEDYVCSPLLAEDINSCRAKYNLTMPWQICCIAKGMSWTCCVQSLFQQDQVNSSDTSSFALSRNSRNFILHELARGIFLYEMHCMRVEHMAAAGSFDDITTLGSSERSGEDYFCSPLLAEDINSCRAKYKLTMPWQICCIAKCMSWTCCVQSLFQQDQVNSSDTLSFALSRNSRNSILHELARGIFLYEMHCMRVEHMAAAGSFDDITTLGSSERPGEDYVCSPLLAEDINSCRAKYKLTMPWQICCIAKCMSWTCCVQSLFQQDQVNSSDTLSFALSRNSRNSILHELARGIFLYEMHCMRVEHMAAAGSFDDITTLGSSERPGEDYVCSPLLAEDINSCRAKYNLTMPWQICCIVKGMSWTCCVQSLFQQDQVNSSDTLSFALSRNSRNSILHELARGIFLYEMHCMRVEHMAAAGSFDDITTLGSSERPGEDYVCSPLLAEDMNSCRAKYKLTMPWQICCIAKGMSWTCCVQSLFQQDQVNSSDTSSFALSRNSRNFILHELACGIFFISAKCISMRIRHVTAIKHLAVQHIVVQTKFGTVWNSCCVNMLY